jgi:hypothetical protein
MPLIVDQNEPKMCNHWKDLGFDDGGEVCKVLVKRTLCSGNWKECYLSEKQKRYEAYNEILSKARFRRKSDEVVERIMLRRDRETREER